MMMLEVYQSSVPYWPEFQLIEIFDRGIAVPILVLDNSLLD